MSDVLELHPGEDEAHFLYEHLRPIWIPGGMFCHVQQCPRKEKIETLRAFIRHWKAVHVAEVKLFVCDHTDCMGSPVFKTKNDLVRHIQRQHKVSHSEAHVFAASYSTRVEQNTRFVDPRENLPPRRLSTSAEMARQSDRIRRHQFKGVLPDLEGKGSDPINAVCRDEVVTFDPQGNVTGKKYRRRYRQP